MTRLTVILFAAVMALAPLSQAAAQDWRARGGGDRSDSSSSRRMISEAEAASRAQSQARGARWVGSQGLQGDRYVFLFERDGRTFTVSVPAYR
jgi:hypothetical protein